MTWKISTATVLFLILATATLVTAEDKNLVAKVNGVGITQVEFDRDLKIYAIQQKSMPGGQQGKEQQPGDTKKEVLDGLIGRELLWQEAKAKNLLVDDKKVTEELDRSRSGFASKEEFVKKLNEGGFTEDSYRKFLSQVLSIQNLVENDIGKTISVSDKEAHDFYTSNPDKFKMPEQVHARHILVKVDPNADQATKDAAKKKAEGILKQAQGGADFAELAKNNSDCPSKQNGGDLGSFPRGQMAKPFEDAAFAMKPGTLSGVVETQFGYHIIKLEERKDATQVPEKDVAEEIKEYLKQQKTIEGVEARLKTLRSAAKIELLTK